MIEWMLLAAAAAVAAGAAAFVVGRALERSRAAGLVRRVSVRAAEAEESGVVDFASLSGLPAPVARYLRHSLADGQPRIHIAALLQSGTLRTQPTAPTWMPFEARQLAAPPARAFLWDARVTMAPAMHVRVLDSYVDGRGAGRVSLFSALRIAADAGTPELNSGALHRYLAEAVWFPTALLPGAGVEWASIDDRTARATLTDGDTTVSLEFRFSDAGEVSGIYSPGRWGSFAGGYRRVPWEGHFRDYRTQAGMRVPSYGEVGWYVDGAFQLVWKGRIVEARYEFGSSAEAFKG